MEDDIDKAAKTSPAMSARSIMVVALCVWLVGAALATWGLMRARDWGLRELPTADATAAWGEWRQAASKPTAGVERRAPKTSEPPLLVLLRDHFPALLVGALLPWTFLVGFAAYIARRAGAGRALRERSASGATR